MCAHIAFVDGGQWLTTAVFLGFYLENDLFGSSRIFW